MADCVTLQEENWMVTTSL